MVWWVALVLGVALINAFVNILDKHVVSSELKDPIFCTTFFGIVNFVLMAIIFVIAGQNLLWNSSTIFAMISGVALAFGVIFYYKALEHEEVSRVLPMLAIIPLFVLGISTVFLGETFSSLSYVGIVALVSGAFLISIKNIKHIRLSKVFGIVIIAAVFFAIRTPLIRKATFGLNFMQTAFFVSLGLFIVALILFVFHHPRIRGKMKIRGLEYLALADGIGVGAVLLSVWALSLAEASLVSALGSVQDFFVFLLAIMFAHKGFVKEHLGRRTILLKIIAIALIILGSILII
ncbi:MAG: EamA family transporter [archaeon]|nr:MAG: EamA family transporter [archaeon]